MKYLLIALFILTSVFAQENEPIIEPAQPENTNLEPIQPVAPIANSPVANPRNWDENIPLLSNPEDVAFDQMIAEIDPEQFLMSYNILAGNVVVLYKTTGLNCTPCESASFALKFRTLWHDLTRLYYFFGVKELSEYYNVVENNVKIVDFIKENKLSSDPLETLSQIERRIQTVRRILGE